MNWTAQLRGAGPLEASDPLCGVEPLDEIMDRTLTDHLRWLWPVAPGPDPYHGGHADPTSPGILES